jgi:hypothetical protein
MSREVTIRESFYYCYQDEKHFFRWLESIPSVKRVVGGPKGLTIQFKAKGPDRDDWADLLGLLARYGIDMRPLRVLVTPEHESWLKDPRKYWHSMMWSPARRRPNAAERRALAAAELRTFVVKYGRKAQKGVEPNDRRYDEDVEKAVKRMKPEKLDKLLRDDED